MKKVWTIVSIDRGGGATLAIECRRDLLRLDQVVSEETYRALVEGDVNIPETKAPVARVLDISGRAIIGSREVIQDKVMVEGVLHYDILYVPEGEEQVEAAEADIGFTQYLDAPGAKPKMSAWLGVDIEHLEYELISGRRLNVKAVLNLSGKVSQVTELEAVRDFDALSDVQALSEHVEASISAGAGRTQAMVREDLELTDAMPSIRKILKKDIGLRIKDKKVLDNKVTVNGTADIRLLYLCEDEDEPFHFIQHEIGFTHTIDIPGAYQGMDCTVDAEVSEFYADPREDINGEFRIIDAEAIINLEAEVFEPLGHDILVDAYSPSVPMELKKRKVTLSRFVGEGRDQAVVKESITFPAGIPKARRILFADVKPVVTDERVEAGKVILEGVLSTRLIYQTNDPDQLLGSFSEDIPFSHTLEIEGADSGMSCMSEVHAENLVHALLAQDEAELKVVLSVGARVTHTYDKEVIIGADEADQSLAQDSGIYIYFVQPGDNLWSVAKKYNTTTSAIRRFNDIDEDGRLVPGTRLIIYKKLNSPAI